jgi:hypothetical protein
MYPWKKYKKTRPLGEKGFTTFFRLRAIFSLANRLAGLDVINEDSYLLINNGKKLGLSY